VDHRTISDKIFIEKRKVEMAHHKSAKKRIKQTIKKTERNRYYRTRMKNIVRAVREAAEAGDKAKALEAFKVANKQLHHYVSKGFLKKQTASRKVSRLHKLVNSIEAA
jgi:small subunit ribosomal protein S20